MKDRIGTTRSGKAIELTWDFIQGRRIALSMTVFDQEADEFDAVVVAQSKCSDYALSQDPVAQYEAEEIEDLMGERLKNFGEDRLLEMAAQMGLHTAMDIRRYGQSLYFPRLIGAT